MRESKIEKDVRLYAESLGWYVLKFVSPGKRGVPDRLFLRSKSKPVFVEFKATDKVGRKQQKRRQEELMLTGCLVFECDSIERGKNIFDMLGDER